MQVFVWKRVKHRLAVLLATLILTSPLRARAEWEPVGVMSSPRSVPASAMSRGQWLIAGGDYSSGRGLVRPTAVDVLEANPGSGQLEVREAAIPPLPRGRSFIESAAAPSGAVLLSGGFAPKNGFPRPAADAEVWTGTTWLTTQMLSPRAAHAAAFVAGEFVVAGGWGEHDERPPTTETLRSDVWEPAADFLGDGRIYPSLTTLADDRHVLLVGGCDPTGGGGPGIAVAELFDATSRTWRKTGSMKFGRCTHRAARLADGRVIVTGGYKGNFEVASSVEIFDPATETWTEAASMLQARDRHAMVVVPDGRVVVAGGTSDSVHGEAGALASAELYDPETNTWTALPSMAAPRWLPTMTFANDSVYIAGGLDAQGAIATIERLPLPHKGERNGGCRCQASETTGSPSALGAAAMIGITGVVIRRRARKGTLS